MGLTRRDLVVVAAVEAAALGGTLAGHHFHAHTVYLSGWVLLALAPLPLLVRRHHPVAALAGTFILGLAYALTGSKGGAQFLPLVVAFIGAVVAGHRRAAATSLAAGYAGFVWVVPAVTGDHLPTAAFSVGILAWLLVLLSAGELLRFRHERAAEAARSAMRKPAGASVKNASR